MPGLIGRILWYIGFATALAVIGIYVVNQQAEFADLIRWLVGGTIDIGDGVVTLITELQQGDDGV